MRRPVTALAVLLAATAAVTASGSGAAYAHGSMQNPLSRLEGCYLEGPEHPVTAACQAAVAAGGTAPFYDWMSLRIGDAAGRHRELIPDGQLCSAGQAAYRGLDLPRADWPATNLPAGADYTFRFRATAPHRGTFQLYLTNAHYSPTKPLTWADLDAAPFLTVTDPQLSEGQYLLPGRLPAGRTGRQLLYAIWQRSDSPEAFYSCSDVVFDGSGSTGGTAPVPSTPPTMNHSHPATTPSPAQPAAQPPAQSPAQQATPSHAALANASLPGSTTTPSRTPAPKPATAPDGTPVAASLAQTGTGRATILVSAVGTAFVLAGAATAFLQRRRHAAGAHARRTGGAHAR
ncbi:Putative chitin-binding protein [Kitasatospora sp. MMS16-BH015]|uniref:lytic polysaccharide monooxygenase auxiliary activity family 9 protein n=1 Tax=Kitasatospora sp. MMS16-BH015 TaxID=2018025 RepID=UPI000CA301B7|nr:lytic polysaccharide monooxygenase [Kitasatospora sp. MMS16-BH015]AUG77409.1 Putative chitin-binding protein [Kitasatospora sp. MMS16-BH015]